ncbi:SNF2 family N-terminal domain-containing protein, partial [Dioszegia hungarica]
LQEFFQDSLASFSDDQDVDKALQTLGLANMDAKLPDLLVTLMPHQILGVAFMLDKEKDRRYQGGLLCDAMGLGKTVQTIAIIVKNKSVDPRVKTTLIVAPLAVLNQWKSEIESKTTEGLLKVGIHHGVSKYKLAKEFKQFDIVLTTYGTLISDFAETKKKKKRLYPLPGGANDSDEEDDAPPPPARKKGPCFRFRFFRIVLDESHIIRNKSTQASRAVADLDAIYRWSLSGTIVNNSLDDVFPHLRFLSISPQSEWSDFKKHITDRVKKAPRLAANRTQAILKTCMIRRHKESELNGQRLLNLPPKETTHVELDFGPEERAIYDQVEHRMKIKFGNFLKQGTVLKNMSCVLTMLMRLRQLTCHPWLLRRNPGDPAHPEDFVVSDEDLTLSLNVPVVNAGEDFLKAATTLGPEWVLSVSNKLRERYESIQKGDQQADDGGHTDDDCAICFEPFATETLTECKHSFCFTCITGWFTNPPTAGGDLTDEQAARGARKCPFCREVIESTKLYAAAAFFQPEVDKDPEAGMDEGSSVVRAGKRKSDDEFLAARPKSKKDKKGKGKERAVEEEEMDEITNVLPSTKMKVMGDLLDEYLAEDGIKVIIFSEFVTYLKLVEVFLDNKGIKNRIYHGGMRQSDRLDVIREFTGEVKDENSPRVMLISRKAGGAGLNLTAASKVISLDLAWNAASENQATDRAHRIGQTRPVDIRRLIINGTVEQRILALQEKKSALADGAMGEGAGGRLGRLTVQDLMRLFDYNAADD